MHYERDLSTISVLDHTYGFIGLLDVHGRVLQANKTALDRIGAERSEVIGRLLWDTPLWRRSNDPPDKLKRAVEVAGRGEFVRFEASFTGPDGKERILDVSLKPLTDDEGKVVNLIPEGRDVTSLKRMEKDLRESESMYRTIFENTGTCMLLYGDDVVVRLANDEFIRQTGYTREEVVGKMRVTDFIAEESLPLVMKYHEMRGLDPDSVPKRYEVTVMTRDGQKRDGMLAVSIVPGTRTRVASFVDISDVKRMQQDLVESEHRYRAIFETTGTGTFIFEDDYTITLANEEFLRITGYERGEVEGLMRATDFILPEYLPMIQEYHSRRLADPGSVPGSYEIRVRHKDGSIHDGMITIGTIPGTTRRVLSFMDITDRKRMEETLRESESKYRTIFETTGTNTFMFDGSMTIQLANEEFTKQTGFAREEIVGRMKATEFVCTEYLPLIQKYHELRKTDPESVPSSYEIKARDKRGFIHEGLINVNSIPGTELRVASFVDMTERRRAEQQMYRSEKMAALGQLIAGVAHEINNPNNFIHFNLPVLKKYVAAMKERLVDGPLLNMTRDEFVADLDRLIDNMQHGSSRITEIVADLKAHISVDREESMESVPIDDVIERVRTLVGKQVAKTVRRLEYEVEPGLPPILMFPGRIEQVLINLVINAAQAADKEDSWIRISASRGESSVKVVVSDNGCGIAPSEIDKIFEPFFTTKDREVGTGLGLWISHRIVEDHGGTITVDSAPGRGTFFSIDLPVVVDPAGASAT
jgi:PAS domain S-box-containing protein